MTFPLEHNGIAVVGMAGRFPKAPDVERFWKNLQDGVEAISFFSAQELAESGVPPAVLDQPNYVRAKGVLEGADLFDASFFDFSPREAEVTDPQIRTFLECAWHALENAGCDPETFPGLIGVYAGMSISTYLLHIASQSRSSSLGVLRMLLGNDKDHLAPWTSYKLNLRGPSINVQTACSTSLVAIHMACQSLRNFECDAALAGGVSIVVPQKTGHFFEPGGILSSDGCCRAFDRKADGSVSGEGVGIVLLKRLEDAIENRDTVLAVIKGSAVNNDGGKKVGYTAPGVEGQAQVIAMAMAAAEIEPEALGYVEAHGSGTALGDPVEMAALAQAFQGGDNRPERVAVGSVKTNIGHLATAAGVAGFIKTVLAIRDGVLPPSLHFEEPNPRMLLEQTPFYVNTKLSPWPEENRPRRAGVSSFGLGGTNVHVVLEEAPPPSAEAPSRNWHLLLLSAKTKTALEQATKNLAEHLRASSARLDDVAFTLRAGRKAFAHRRMAVCRDTEDAINVLENRAPGRLVASAVPEKPGPIVFLFPGMGDHYLDMGRGLYEEEPYYARCIDECFGFWREHLRLDLKELAFPKEKVRKTLDAGVQTPLDLRKAFAEWNKVDVPCAQREIPLEMAQLVLFIIEHSLARLFMHWGIRPAGMLGYSLGEYVAACIAGVMSLPEALGLLAGRARLIQDLPPGAMLAVSLPESQTAPLLTSGLSIAGINGPAMCTVAGSIEEIEQLEEKLRQNKQAVFRRLSAGHAYHSSLMTPAAKGLTAIAGQIHFKPPQIPYLSNVTGTWTTSRQATDPGYWSMHLCSPVRFQQGVEELCSRMEPVFLEIGPGQMLSSLVEQHANRTRTERPVIVQSLPHSLDKQPDRAFLLQALGRLWLAGNTPDWNKVSESEICRHVPLPLYPFERQRYWIDGNVNEFLRPGNGVSPPETIGTAEHGTANGAHPRPLSSVEYVAPSTQMEQRLTEIMEEILGIRPVGIHDSFFQMGGNSLSGLRLISQLREAFGIDLSVQKLFLAPTIAALAPVVEEEILTAIEGMDEAEVS
jgi:acyl transferase domain-containing protein